MFSTNIYYISKFIITTCKKSALATPESKNLVVSSSKFPLAASNNSDESNSIALSVITVFVKVPANVGCSDWVATALKFKALVTLEIIAVALELKLPNLSTALIR